MQNNQGAPNHNIESGADQGNDGSGLGKFNLSDNNYHPQTIASAVAAAAAAAASQQYQQQQPPSSPAPMFPGPSTIPTNFSSSHINSAEALQQFQRDFWKAHMASIEDNVPDFKTHLLPLARIKKVMKSDPDVKVQMISAEAPILFSKACEIFITEISQRAWMNAEENKRRTLQRQDVSFAAQRSEMFDFLIDVVPREEFSTKKAVAQPTVTVTVPVSATKAAQALKEEPAAAPPVVHQQQQLPPQPQPQSQHHQQQPHQVHQQHQHQHQQQQPQSASLYNDPTFQQYYTQHFGDATVGYPPPQAGPGPTPEQRSAYYQQIEREQLQWLQRQTNMAAPQQQQHHQQQQMHQHPISGSFTPQRMTGGVNDPHLSPPMQQQQQKQHQDLSSVKSEDRGE